ncbi:MAG: signal peptidase II [bacterium]|nr:signal peptidase II [bacterium]
MTFLICLCVLILDRISKFIVQKTMYEGESIPVLPHIFSLSYIKNEGIAFGLFANHSGAWLALVGFLTVGIIFILLLRLKTINLWITLSFGLILGGAVGNLWDRIWLGGVVDFIDIGYKNYRWPAFNLADSMICVGVLMLLVTINKK